jgi:hypothetical protein
MATRKKADIAQLYEKMIRNFGHVGAPSPPWGLHPIALTSS